MLRGMFKNRIRGEETPEGSESAFLTVKKQPIPRPGEIHTQEHRWTVICNQPEPNDPDVQKIREGWAKEKGVIVPAEDTEFEALKCRLYETPELKHNPLTVIFDQFSGEIAIIPGRDEEDMDVVVDDVALYDVLPRLRRPRNRTRPGYATKVEIGYELGKFTETGDSIIYEPRR